MLEAAGNLCLAKPARAADEAAKAAVLDGTEDIGSPALLAALTERKAAAL